MKLSAVAGCPVDASQPMSRVPFKCSRCGLVNPMGTNSCNGCGASLTGSPPTQTPNGSSVAQLGSSSPSTPQAITSTKSPTMLRPQVTPALTPVPAKSGTTQPPLHSFGWRTLRGTVIRVEPVYMGAPDSRWLLWLVKVALLAVAVYYFGLVILILIAGLIALVWLLSKLLPRGFVATVAVQVVGFSLTRRLTGSTRDVPVRDFRIRDAAGLETQVRMKGQLTGGSVTVGDDVLVEGWERSGMLHFRRGYNHRIRAVLRTT